MDKEINNEKEEGERKCLELELKSQQYCDIMKRAKNLKNEEERDELIKQLKQIGLYDHRHPYFAEESPFFMNKTEEQFLEVTAPVEFNAEKFSLIELRPTASDKLENK